MDEFPRALLTAVASRYRFERVLGRGGMGTVYLAEDLKHHRQVAIKTIQPEFISESARDRFAREIQVTARLQHPHILPLLDSGVVGQLLYYVMPYVEGESLAERLEGERQLPIADALHIAREVADALQCAHDSDIVHRDIKPANILLSGGHVLVMDFGIARALDEIGGGALTSLGTSMGTPTYVSPEQATDAASVDARSDIYSLGCVLYEMLAGQPPFTGATAAVVIRQHVNVEPAPVSNHRPAVPADVLPILDKALAKSPADRFARAKQFSEALAKLGGPATLAAPVRRLNPLIALGIYLVVGWAVLEIVDRLAATAGLPSWVVPFALVLLLIGVPIILVTSVIQYRAGSPGSLTRPGEALTPRHGSRTRGAGSGTSGVATSARRLFSWRNAIGGGVLALALWGVVAIGWIIWFRDGTADSDPPSVALEEAQDPTAAPLQAPGIADAAGAAGGAAPVASEAVVAADEPTQPAQRTAPEATARDPVIPAGPDPGAVAAAQDRELANEARNVAASAGALALGSPLLARADSLRVEGQVAERGGRYADAARAFLGARVAYGQAETEARTIWAARVDSARQSVDSLRQEADRSVATFADAERLRDEGGRLAASREYTEALATWERAARTYERSRPSVGPSTPAVENPASIVEEPRPTPEDRIRAVMDRLERAYEAADVEAVERVWVDLGADDAEALRDAFDRMRDIDYQYQLDPTDIQDSGETIDFRVQVRLTYRVGGSEGSSDETQAFRLTGSPTGDVIRQR